MSLGLVLVRARLHEEVLEEVDLLLEDVHVGQVDAVVGDVVIVELDLAQALGRPLLEQEVVIGQCRRGAGPRRTPSG